MTTGYLNVSPVIGQHRDFRVSGLMPGLPFTAELELYFYDFFVSGFPSAAYLFRLGSIVAYGKYKCGNSM